MQTYKRGILHYFNFKGTGSGLVPRLFSILFVSKFHLLQDLKTSLCYGQWIGIKEIKLKLRTLFCSKDRNRDIINWLPLDKREARCSSNYVIDEVTSDRSHIYLVWDVFNGKKGFLLQYFQIFRAPFLLQTNAFFLLCQVGERCSASF